MNARRSGSDPARVLAGLFVEMDSYRRAVAQRATLGTADMRLLWLLSDGEARTLRQIAEQLNLEQSTVNRQVNTAMGADLLLRQREGDAGPYRFAASSRGAREFERNLNATLDTFREALAELGAEQHRFLESMRAYATAYERASRPHAADG